MITSVQLLHVQDSLVVVHVDCNQVGPICLIIGLRICVWSDLTVHLRHKLTREGTAGSRVTECRVLTGAGAPPKQSPSRRKPLHLHDYVTRGLAAGTTRWHCNALDGAESGWIRCRPLASTNGSMLPVLSCFNPGRLHQIYTKLQQHTATYSKCCILL